MPALALGGAIYPASHFPRCQRAAGDKQGAARIALNTTDPASTREREDRTLLKRL
jgi:hypothetical protein